LTTLRLNVSFENQPKVASSLVWRDLKNQDVNYSAQSKPCVMHFFLHQISSNLRLQEGLQKTHHLAGASSSLSEMVMTETAGDGVS